MFNIFPYIFSTTLNAVTSNIGLIDKIVDNVVNSVNWRILCLIYFHIYFQLL